MNRVVISIVLLFAFIVGCAIFAPEVKKTPEEEKKELLDKYEKDFDPSAYDDEVQYDIDEEINNLTPVKPDTKDSVEPEIISGFRIQLSMTTNIDEANLLKSEASAKLPNDWAYVIYEAPYYKVRVGDYNSRSIANQSLRSLIDMGYSNAWIVPDRVYKVPPPKPSDPNVNFEEN
ncbi:MAG: SPOR domain-containing protein [Bacteroidota bacterium]|nr:SPOR domain-containing protein [Bacteroidota bacterium]